MYAPKTMAMSDRLHVSAVGFEDLDGSFHFDVASVCDGYYHPSVSFSADVACCVTAGGRVSGKKDSGGVACGRLSHRQLAQAAEVPCGGVNDLFQPPPLARQAQRV